MSMLSTLLARILYDLDTMIATPASTTVTSYGSSRGITRDLPPGDGACHPKFQERMRA